MRPFVFLNAAMSADGKLAPNHGKYVPFGSALDRQTLLELRATADAVMAGARTVDSFPVNMGPGPAKYRRQRLARGLSEYNLRIVVTGSGSLDPGAEIFRHRFSPIILLTSGGISPARLRKLQAVADEVRTFGREKLDLSAALEWLYQAHGVKRLLCEGGGELNAALFESDLVDELHLTICPILFGGRSAPTLSGGKGVKMLTNAAKLRIISTKRVGDELYLTLRRRETRLGTR